MVETLNHNVSFKVNAGWFGSDPMPSWDKSLVIIYKYQGRRCIFVGNLFALRATEPKRIKAASDPVGADNDLHLKQMCLEAVSGVRMQAGGVMTAMKYGKVICAWGANGSFVRRDRDVIRRLQEWGVKPKALRITSKGAPEHPLYVPYDVMPIELENRSAPEVKS